MRRRHFLAASVASTLPLTGCLDAFPSTTRVRTPAIAVESERDEPANARIDVTVLEQFSEQTPARIEISYTSTAPNEREVDFGSSPPFSEYWSTGRESPRLVIIPDDHSHISPTGTEPSDSKNPDSTQLVPDSPVDGCWRAPNFAVFGVGHTRTLAPQETVSEGYTVLGHVDNENCLPSGTYHFVQEHYFGHDQSWGFTIQLE